MKSWVRESFWLRLAGVALVLYFGLMQESYGQRPPDWPTKIGASLYSQIYNATKACYGYILLKNGDTLKGVIKVLPYLTGAYPGIEVMPSNNRTRRPIVIVARTKIDYARTYPDPDRPDSGYTDFVNLHNKDLWRRLASKKDIAIYDDYTPNVDPRPFGEEMILVGKEKKWIKIYHHGYADLDTEIAPRMLEFINRRYGVHLQRTDFKDTWGMIHYILDRE